MARTGRALAAVVAALCCGAAASCDNLADLMGRLSLDAAVPAPRQRTAFTAPGAALLAGRALPCAPSPTAQLSCGRAPAFSVGYPLLGSRAALAGGEERAFWAPVAAASRTRSAVAALAMRSSSRKVKSVVPPSSVRPGTRIQQRPSHQVLVLNASYEPLSVISAPRALMLIWDGKANTVVGRSTWTSAGGEAIDVPSVVSLRRYIKVGQRRPPLNRKTILMRDHGLCQYCGKCAENIDHVIPRSRGGGTTWENCVAACKPCNSRKGAKYLKDMPGMKLRRQPGPPTALSWVHSAVWKVDPRWRPYIGEISWEDIQKQLNAGSKKHGKRKMGKGKAKAKSKAAGAAGKLDGEAEAEAENVIAAYTGGLDQS